MQAVIFAGTTEGRELSWLLAERGAAITVFTATAYGREEQGERPGITVLAGRMEPEEMALLLRGKDLCIDATHPYALEATKNIRAACAAAEVPYRRLVREAAEAPLRPEELVSSAGEAAARLADREGRILLATGTKELGAFSALPPERLYPRVLPTCESLQLCERMGIPHRNILAMQGPFSRELNEALIRQFQISAMVTKDGGVSGGFPEKVQAARNTDIRLLVIRRPEESGDSLERILEDCEVMMRC